MIAVTIYEIVMDHYRDTFIQGMSYGQGCLQVFRGHGDRNHWTIPLQKPDLFNVLLDKFQESYGGSERLPSLVLGGW